MSDEIDEDFVDWLKGGPDGVPISGTSADRVPHVLTVHSYDEDDDMLECDVSHPATCKVVEVMTDVWDYSCQVAVEISEGGGVLAALRTAGDVKDEEGLEPGTYYIEGWTTTYPSTPDHPTEYDAGIRFVTEEEPVKPEAVNTLQKMLDEMGDVRVRFWACIVPAHNHVTWQGDVARCAEPGCAVTSLHTQDFVEQLRKVLLVPLGQEVRPWEPKDGDRRCQECGIPNVVWFTESPLWNEVMPRDGILCIPCFVRKAEAMGHNDKAWFLAPERPALEWQPGRWWRSIDPDGELWGESSDEEEIRRMARPTDKIQHLFVTVQRSEWRDA